MIAIRRLLPADAAAFHTLRLAGLQDTPSAFGSSWEEEHDLPLATLQGRLAEQADRGVFGAFDGERLVGLVALGRESMRKLQHKGMIWGMYVAPEARGQGVARALMDQALALARSVESLRQVNLCVNAANGPALRLYESLGFVAYGHERGAMCVDGVLHDEIHMALPLRNTADAAEALRH